MTRDRSPCPSPHFTNPASSQGWPDALPILTSVQAPLWVILKGAPLGLAVPQLLAQMATESQAAGVQTVIYLHWGTDIESAAEAELGTCPLSRTLFKRPQPETRRGRDAIRGGGWRSVSPCPLSRARRRHCPPSSRA
jgi:hypothetical protein